MTKSDHHHHSRQDAPVGHGGAHGTVVLSGGASIGAGTLEWSYSRAGGPGGQNVNKTSSRATLWVPVGAILGLSDNAKVRLRELASAHLVSGDRLQFIADEHRSQHMNKDACLDRLREFVLRAARPPRIRRKTKPSRSSKERRLNAKARDSGVKKSRGWRGEE